MLWLLFRGALMSLILTGTLGYESLKLKKKLQQQPSIHFELQLVMNCSMQEFVVLILMEYFFIITLSGSLQVTGGEKKKKEIQTKKCHLQVQNTKNKELTTTKICIFFPCNFRVCSSRWRPQAPRHSLKSPCHQTPCGTEAPAAQAS